MTDPQAHVVFDPATLHLREERAVVGVLREPIGHVTVRREREVRSETFTVDLVTETLYLTLGGDHDAALQVVVEGDERQYLILQSGETHQLVIYREEAQVRKDVVIYEQVRIGKRAVVEQETVKVALQREVLDVKQAVYVTGQSEFPSDNERASEEVDS